MLISCLLETVTDGYQNTLTKILQKNDRHFQPCEVSFFCHLLGLLTGI
jgi:hypothetical protein